MENIEKIINQAFSSRGRVGKLYPVVFDISENWKMKNRNGVFFGRFILSGDASVKVKLKGQEMTINKDFTSEVLFEELLSVSGLSQVSNEIIDFSETNLFNDNDYLKIRCEGQNLTISDIDGQSVLISAVVDKVGGIDLNQAGNVLKGLIKKVPTGFYEVVVNANGKVFEYIPENVGSVSVVSQNSLLKGLKIESSSNEYFQIEADENEVRVYNKSVLVSTISNHYGESKNFPFGKLSITQKVETGFYSIDCNSYLYEYTPAVGGGYQDLQEQQKQDYIEYAPLKVLPVQSANNTLYNYYTTEKNDLFPENFRVATVADLTDLINESAIDSQFILKTFRTLCFQGKRSLSGDFSAFNTEISLWAGESFISDTNAKALRYTSAFTLPTLVTVNKKCGASILLCSDIRPNDQIIDRDGNIYDWVEISGKYWLNRPYAGIQSETGNIQNLVGDAEWGAAVLPAYCYYNNQVQTVAVYPNILMTGYFKFENDGNDLILSHFENDEWLVLNRFPIALGLVSNFNIKRIPEVGQVICYDENFYQYNLIENHVAGVPVLVSPETVEHVNGSVPVKIPFRVASLPNYFETHQLLGVSIVNEQEHYMFKIFEYNFGVPALIHAFAIEKNALSASIDQYAFEWDQPFNLPVYHQSVDYIFNSMTECFEQVGGDLYQRFDIGDIDFNALIFDACEYGKVFITVEKNGVNYDVKAKNYKGSIVDFCSVNQLGVVKGGVNNLFIILIPVDFSGSRSYCFDQNKKLYSMDYPIVQGSNIADFLQVTVNGVARPVLKIDYTKAGNVISNIKVSDHSGATFQNQSIVFNVPSTFAGVTVRILNLDYMKIFADGNNTIFVNAENRLVTYHPQTVENGVPVNINTLNVRVFMPQTVQYFPNADSRILVDIQKGRSLYELFISVYKANAGVLVPIVQNYFTVPSGQQVRIDNGLVEWVGVQDWENFAGLTYMYDIDFFLKDFNSTGYKLLTDSGFDFNPDENGLQFFVSSLTSAGRRVSRFDPVAKTGETALIASDAVNFGIEKPLLIDLLTVKNRVACFVKGGEVYNFRRGARVGYPDVWAQPVGVISQPVIISAFRGNDGKVIIHQFYENFTPDNGVLIGSWEWTSNDIQYGNFKYSILGNTGLGVWLYDPADGNFYKIEPGNRSLDLTAVDAGQKYIDGVVIPAFYQYNVYFDLEPSKIPVFTVLENLPQNSGFEYMPIYEDSVHDVIHPAVYEYPETIEYEFQDIHLKSGHIVDSQPEKYLAVYEDKEVRTGYVPAEFNPVNEVLSAPVFQFNGFYADFE